MSDAGNPTPNYEASPEEALAQLAGHEGPLCVDLDGTLYRRNSTEDFLDSARPGLLAAVTLNVLEAIKPWRWTGGAPTRDVWRVWIVWTLFPWTHSRWRRRVATLASSWSNRRLVEALQAHKANVVIVTVGFRPIVRPLLTALGFSADSLVAPRLGFEDRIKGKLNLAMEALGEERVASSLFITDSLDDLEMLASCLRPLLTCWPDAEYHRAFERIYLPGQYVGYVKHPGERYVWRAVIQEDLAHWVFSSVALAAYPLRETLGLCFLLASFWIIYERGYVDNDWAALHLESDGKLSQGFWSSRVATPMVQPWVWAVLIGVVAVYLLGGRAAVPINLAKWLLVLGGTYWVFKLYNRIDKSSRAWLYVVLQLARAGAFLAIVPTVPVGGAALGSLALSRWISYYLYRRGDGDWPQLDTNVIRLVFFVVLAALLGVSLGSGALLNWTAALLLAWNLFRARRELAGLLRRAHFIRRRDTRSPLRQGESS